MDLKKAIGHKDVESFNLHLAELERLFQDDDNAMREQLTASGALCYAAWIGSVPMMDTLIQKGVGKHCCKMKAVSLLPPLCLA